MEGASLIKPDIVNTKGYAPKNSIVYISLYISGLWMQLNKVRRVTPTEGRDNRHTLMVRSDSIQVKEGIMGTTIITVFLQDKHLMLRVTYSVSSSEYLSQF